MVHARVDEASLGAPSAAIKTCLREEAEKNHLRSQPGQEELDLKGIAHIGGPADAGKVVDLAPGHKMEHDHDVSAVQRVG